MGYTDVPTYIGRERRCWECGAVATRVVNAETGAVGCALCYPDAAPIPPPRPPDSSAPAVAATGAEPAPRERYRR